VTHAPIESVDRNRHRESGEGIEAFATLIRDRIKTRAWQKTVLTFPQPPVTSNLALGSELDQNGQGGGGTESRERNGHKSCVL